MTEWRVYVYGLPTMYARFARQTALTSESQGRLPRFAPYKALPLFAPISY